MRTNAAITAAVPISARRMILDFTPLAAVDWFCRSIRQSVGCQVTLRLHLILARLGSFVERHGSARRHPLDDAIDSLAPGTLRVTCRIGGKRLRAGQHEAAHRYHLQYPMHWHASKYAGHHIGYKSHYPPTAVGITPTRSDRARTASAQTRHY